MPVYYIKNYTHNILIQRRIDYQKNVNMVSHNLYDGQEIL